MAQAYQELNSEGVLKTVPGAGTFVGSRILNKSKNELHQIIHDAIRKAYALDFKTEDITDVFYDCIGLSVGYSTDIMIIVECNEPVLEYLCKEISSTLHLKTKGILIQKLEKNKDEFKEYLTNSSLIVCGFNHVEELNTIIPDLKSKIMGITMQSDTIVLDTITKVPRGTIVGYVCVNQRSAETFYNSTIFSGHKQLSRIICGLNNTQLLNNLMAECDIVFITNFAYETIDIKVRHGQHIIKLDIAISSKTMESIKQRLI